MIFLPETPKYLAETGEHKKLIDLLCQMYHENTGLPHDNYLVIKYNTKLINLKYFFLL